MANTRDIMCRAEHGAEQVSFPRHPASVTSITTKIEGISMKSFIAMAASLFLAGCVATTTTTSPPTPPPPPPGPNVSGSWTLTVESPMGSNESTATFQQSAGVLTGKIANERGEVELTGTINAADIAFSITINMQGESLKLDYSGAVSGDAMSGTVKCGDYGEGKWSGKKKS
jgi:hypothetical protein